jgi:ABC-type lipoprotein release transport system permease subunit
VTAVAPIAWRNLWRNRRRTALTAGGIGFAVMLLAFAIAQQIGSYAIMIDNATSLLAGHLQIQRAGYRDDPRIEATFARSSELRAAIEALPGVDAATERVEAYMLASVGERSFAAELVGVDPRREGALSTLPELVSAGAFLGAGGSGVAPDDVELYAGEALAKNLGVEVGGEVVLLGTDSTGGVAALVTRLVGTFATGQPDVDRALMLAPIDAVRAAFGLGDEAHAIAVRGEDVADTDVLVREIGMRVPGESVVLPWSTLVPELAQTIDLDRVSSRIFYGLLVLLVTFSVVNSFVMLVFERTREFGVLLAIGMRPWRIIGMLQLEALWLALLGAAIGVAIAVPIVAWVAAVGLPLGDAGEMLSRFHMPDRVYTALDVRAFLEPSLVMLAATAVAALLPSLRVRRLVPVEALRAE